MATDWQTYYRQTKDKPPSATLVRALEEVKRKGQALDLGSGAMKDSRFLLREGFARVTAVDREPAPADILESLPAERFSFVQAPFDGFDFPEGRFDLINAQFSLPFATPAAFGIFWPRIVASLAPGGIFVGQFFGDRDGWNVPGTEMTFLTATQAREALAGLETILFDEKEYDANLASGAPHHWHLFHVIARKT